MSTVRSNSQRFGWARWVLLVGLGLIWLTSAHSRAASPSPRGPGFYDFGNPVLLELWVDPLNGDDSRLGGSPDQALQTLDAAWRMTKDLNDKGYKILLKRGVYRINGQTLNRLSGRRATNEYPIIIQSADGPGLARIQGGLVLADVSFLYLIDLAFEAGGKSPILNPEVIRVERSDHVLLRGLTITGPDPALASPGPTIAKHISGYRSQQVYVERCRLTGCTSNSIELEGVQWGHSLANSFQAVSGWAFQARGGSAYLRFGCNNVDRCAGGVLVGGRSNFARMQTPWLHYEAYDVKVTNNLFTDVPASGVSVAGGYNVLIAYNTLYRVGIFNDGSGVGYPLFSFTHGERFCAPDESLLGQDATEVCRRHLEAGGWGTLDPTPLRAIPNRGVLVYNNLIYNPPPVRTLHSHFGFAGPVITPPGSNLPNPAVADGALELLGNVIWNGNATHPLGNEDAGNGCQPAHDYCRSDQIRNGNEINTIHPELMDPFRGNFRPKPDGNLVHVRTQRLLDFGWHDAPTRPPVPVGERSNAVPEDHDGIVRTRTSPPGAFFRALDTAFTVGGVITDRFGLPVPGVTLTFQRVAGPGKVPANVVSDEQGVWSQRGFQDETTYRVTPTLTGSRFEPGQADFQAASKSLNFEALPDGFAVQGYIFTERGDPIAGVKVQFDLLSRNGSRPASVFTDVTGRFQQVGFRRGSRYRAAPSLYGYAFGPVSRIFKGPSRILIFRGARRRSPQAGGGA